MNVFHINFSSQQVFWTRRVCYKALPSSRKTSAEYYVGAMRSSSMWKKKKKKSEKKEVKENPNQLRTK